MAESRVDQTGLDLVCNCMHMPSTVEEKEMGHLFEREGTNIGMSGHS